MEYEGSSNGRAGIGLFIITVAAALIYLPILLGVLNKVLN